VAMWIQGFIEMINRVLSVIIVFLLLPVQAIAVDASGLCNATANIAKGAMENRQSGKPYSKVIAILDDTDTPKNLKRLYVTFTDMAYFEPIYKSHKKRQKAVDDFRDQAFTKCITEFSVP
jgi:hypothetical protein